MAKFWLQKAASKISLKRTVLTVCVVYLIDSACQSKLLANLVKVCSWLWFF